MHEVRAEKEAGTLKSTGRYKQCDTISRVRPPLPIYKLLDLGYTSPTLQIDTYHLTQVLYQGIIFLSTNPHY